MKDRLGRYYIGRIHKGGLLTAEKITESIFRPKTIRRGKYNWTIIGAEKGVVYGKNFVAGELIKYDDNGEVSVVNEAKKIEQILTTPGLVVDKSPFVFFDCFSGFAYLHVWNSITEDMFRRRLAELIREKYDDFFVPCEIEPISDIREFTARISGFEMITDIKAKVHPPNPLFGACWKNLKEYLFERRTQTLNVKEEGGKDGGGINTCLQSVIQQIRDGRNLDNIPPLPLTDAAILMATDGYGRGSVAGVDGEGVRMEVHTSETQKSFLFSKRPERKLLASEAYRQFVAISEERSMRHA